MKDQFPGKGVEVGRSGREKNEFSTLKGGSVNVSVDRSSCGGNGRFMGLFWG